MSMSTKKKVAPSLLSANFAALGEDVRRLELAGADWLHVDVMDGCFVPNLTVGIPVVGALKPLTSLPLDVHLMIVEPRRYFEAFVRAGADILTFHVEASDDVKEDLLKIRSLGAKAGLSLRPGTSLEKIISYLPYCDLILVMTVEPGFGGQSFMEEPALKVQELSKLRTQHQLSFLIEVDGGINAETALKVKEADVFVAGSYIFKKDLKLAISSLKRVEENSSASEGCL